MNAREKPSRAWDTLDVTGTYQITPRLNLAMIVPLNINRSSYYDVEAPLATRIRERARARSIGDISVTARSWIFKPSESPKGNIMLGLGLKMPTGNFREKSTLGNYLGQNRSNEPVPLSIMPGDGGLDIITEALAYRAVKFPTKGTIAFAQGSYLITPRGTNGVLSQVGTSENPAWSLNAATLRNNANYNSVPDAYQLRVGMIGPAFPKTQNFKLKGLQWQLAYRWEGSPQHDLFGSNKGFRQPGYFMAIEPGFYYQYKKHLLQFSVPISFLKVALPDLAQKDGSPDPRTTAFAPASVNLRYTYLF
ncbi:MAG: hypothetical protein KGS72_27390 [Cyanobacteria bacterium REEB67]|nr:hypothetical protein [Cyanobacteria bacterium REEB67]